MAGVASHRGIRVGELIRLRRGSPGLSILLDRFREAGLFVVMTVSGRDHIHKLNQLPFLVGFQHRALNHATTLNVESSLTEWSAQRTHVRATGRRRKTARPEGCPLVDGPVTVRAVDFDCR